MTTVITRLHLFLGNGGELKELELYTWRIEGQGVEPAPTTSTPSTTDPFSLMDESGSSLTDESGSPLTP